MQNKIEQNAIETVATVEEQSGLLMVDKIIFLINDGTEDIYINFDITTNSKSRMTVKPGESFTDVPIACETVYFRAKSGEQPFRIWGVTQND